MENKEWLYVSVGLNVLVLLFSVLIHACSITRRRIGCWLITSAEARDQIATAKRGIMQEAHHAEVRLVKLALEGRLDQGSTHTHTEYERR